MKKCQSPLQLRKNIKYHKYEHVFMWSIGSKKKIKDNANKMTTQITKDTMSLNVMTIVKLENHLTLYH